MKKWKNAKFQLTTYDTDTGRTENIVVDLGELQTFVLMKALGIEIENENIYSCFSDETLKDFINKRINPLTLKKPK